MHPVQGEDYQLGEERDADANCNVSGGLQEGVGSALCHKVLTWANAIHAIEGKTGDSSDFSSYGPPLVGYGLWPLVFVFLQASCVSGFGDFFRIVWVFCQDHSSQSVDDDEGVSGRILNCERTAAGTFYFPIFEVDDQIAKLHSLLLELQCDDLLDFRVGLFPVDTVRDFDLGCLPWQIGKREGLTGFVQVKCLAQTAQTDVLALGHVETTTWGEVKHDALAAGYAGTTEFCLHSLVFDQPGDVQGDTGHGAVFGSPLASGDFIHDTSEFTLWDRDDLGVVLAGDGCVKEGLCVKGHGWLSKVKVKTKVKFGKWSKDYDSILREV